MNTGSLLAGWLNPSSVGVLSDAAEAKRKRWLWLGLAAMAAFGLFFVLKRRG